MELKNMKLPPPAAEKATCDPCVMYPREDYPWGLKLHLESESLDALGVAELPEVDTIVTIQAKAKVVSVNTSASANAKAHRSVSLQITDLGIGPAKAKKSSEDVFYNSDAKE